MKIKKLKLNSKGFGHVELLVFLVGILSIGAIGSYVYLHRSHAATITKWQCTNTYKGVWLDLQSQGVDHGPCWSTPGAYLVNWGTGKVGDGIDQVPLSVGKSETFDYPNYIIVVSGKWVACNDKSCTSTSDPFTHAQSPTHYNKVNGKWTANGRYYGGAYPLCTYDFYWYDSFSGGRSLTKFCTDPNIYIKRI